MIRPEVKHAIWRWRDALIATALIAIGLYWIISFHGVLKIIGTIFTCVGLVLLYTGIQRGRFHASHDGIGIVTFIEGQITYFGPTHGNSVAINDIISISLKRTEKEHIWIIHDQNANLLEIPVNARENNVLFDAFAVLSGMNIDKMLRALENNAATESIIWDRKNSEDRQYLH